MTLAVGRSPRRLGGGVCLGWLAVVAVAAMVPGLFSGVDPELLDPDRVLLAPGPGGVFGTDQYGRPVYTLLVHGARTAVTIGVASTLLAVLAGGVIGLLAGYAGGVVDAIVGRFLDLMLSLPGVLLALVITAAAGASVGVLIVSVATAFVAGFARLMRSQVLATRNRLYVEAARSVGLSHARILLRHVLPNAFAPVVVLATVAVGEAILIAASLSFLGLGPKLAVPDWGQLLASGQPYIQQSWWVSTFPGITLSLTVVAVSLLGDRLRDLIE